MQQGRIKLYRQAMENSLYFAEKFTRRQAWCDILLIANHTESFFYVRGNKITVHRGQFAYSENSLAERWKRSRDKVRKFLIELETEGNIIQQKNRKQSIYLVVNYDIYQTTENTTEKQQNIQQKNNRQDNRTDNRQDIYKNDKNDKNDKKIKLLDFVFLSEEEILKLKNIFKEKFDENIEKLNNYIGSTGKKYKSHYFTLLNRNGSQTKNAGSVGKNTFTKTVGNNLTDSHTKNYLDRLPEGAVIIDSL